MPLSVYLHFPFCTNKCSYCDFYKELHDPERERAYYQAVIAETQIAGEKWTSPDRTVNTIFIGGGTPSLASAEFLRDWLRELKQQFDLADDLEFTVENNPDSITIEKLQVHKEIGVTRPTFGIQSFHPDLLRLLDRKHNPDHSRRAVYWTNALAFGNFGVDLIFALPGQTSSMMSRDLDETLDLEPPHISFYQLTIEPGTPLAGQIEAGRLKAADEELTLAMYRGGVEKLLDAGYERYEVSSFARPGLECRHNIAYWEGAPYIGLGPAAHSFIANRRYANVTNIDEYIRALGDGVRPAIEDKSGKTERMAEAIMLGLRMSRGIDRQQFSDRFDTRLEEQIDREQYDLLVESGHVIPDRGRIRLSDDGLLLADEITRRLLR